MDPKTYFKTGDVVKISQKIKEGKKERVISYQGVVVRVKGSGMNKTFTIRQNLEGIDVERILPAELPTLQSIKVIHQAEKPLGKLRISKSDKRMIV